MAGRGSVAEEPGKTGFTRMITRGNASIAIILLNGRQEGGGLDPYEKRKLMPSQRGMVTRRT